MLTYGSEAWTLDDAACKIINGANAAMVSHIRATQRSIQEEATDGTKTFDLLRWIRAHRLRWVGHILRMSETRLIKQALHTIFDNHKDGDILMDIPRVKDWQDLQALAAHRQSWRARVHKLKPPDYSTHFTARIQPTPASSPPSTSQTDSPGYKKFNQRIIIVAVSIRNFLHYENNIKLTPSESPVDLSLELTVVFFCCI